MSFRKPPRELRILALACLAGSSGWPSVAHAQEQPEPPPVEAPTGPFYRAMIATRINPIGLVGEARGGYRVRLFTAPSRSVLLHDTWATLGAAFTLSPASTRVGIAAEVQPLQVLNLQVTWEPLVQWFGGVAGMKSFARVADAGIVNGIVGQVGEVGPRQSARGWSLTLQAILQGRLGVVGLRNTVRAIYNAYDLASLDAEHRADRVYYDPTHDVMARLDGWIVVDDLDVIVPLPARGFNVGARYTVTAPILGDDGDPNRITTTHRVGPLATYTFRERPLGAFNAPTVFVLAQWWVRHPFRTGGDGDGTVSPWVPMVAAGLLFRGDW